jgi:hypothetical protein
MAHDKGIPTQPKKKKAKTVRTSDKQKQNKTAALKKKRSLPKGATNKPQPPKKKKSTNNPTHQQWADKVGPNKTVLKIAKAEKHKMELQRKASSPSCMACNTASHPNPPNSAAADINHILVQCPTMNDIDDNNQHIIQEHLEKIVNSTCDYIANNTDMSQLTSFANSTPEFKLQLAQGRVPKAFTKNLLAIGVKKEHTASIAANYSILLIQRSLFRYETHHKLHSKAQAERFSLEDASKSAVPPEPPGE